MKALSIKQPWLYAITQLDKRIENRTWLFPRQIIGQTIALHASARDDLTGYAAIFEIAGVRVDMATLTRSCIVATATVVGFLRKQENGFSLRAGICSLTDDKWFFGPIGWIFDDVQLLKYPIPARGALGLWEWTPNEPIVYD
jgi:hypothetical protein